MPLQFVGRPGVPRQLCTRRHRDDLWLVHALHEERQILDLQNLSTHHVYSLPFDIIREYRQDSSMTQGSDGFLLLRMQLYLRDGAWGAEPTVTR